MSQVPKWYRVAQVALVLSNIFFLLGVFSTPLFFMSIALMHFTANAVGGYQEMYDMEYELYCRADPVVRAQWIAERMARLERRRHRT